MRSFPVLLLFSLLFVFPPVFSQDDCKVRQAFFIENIGEVNPWTSLDMNDPDCHFQFAIVTDRTGGHRPGVFEDGVQKLNLLQPEFVMSVGDLIEGYTEDTSRLNREWEEFNSFVGQLQMPFFYVPGNHDITNMRMEELWLKRFGKTYYHFIYKDVLFLCLNSEDQRRGAGRGTISDKQYEYIRETVEKHPDVNWTLVFMHQPLWNQEDTKRWADVESLLSDRKHTVFVGHNHRYVKYDRNNGKYFVLATTGGGSGLRGPRFGEFDHVLWVTMTPEGPILANLLLEGIWNEDVSTEASKGYADRLVRGKGIAVEPIYVENGNFEGGKMKIQLRNDEDLPMKVVLKEGFSWDLYGELDTNALELPPNSVQETWLNLEPKKKTAVTKIDPLKLTAELTFDLGEEKGISLPVQLNVKPLPRQILPKISNPQKVDGKLDDWQALRGRLSAGGSGDLDVKYDMAYDAHYLYAAIKVTDDQVLTDTTRATWQQDAINFVISPAPPHESAMSRGDHWYRDELFLRITPETEDMPSKVYRPEDLAEGIQQVCVATVGGYVFEAAIPLSLFEKAQGKDWKGFRMNLFIDDWDSPEEEVVRSWLYPHWSDGDNYVGSGMWWK